MFQRQTLSIAILSAATLLLETTFTRLLAVAQFYHFAFLVVSLALLGFGASGTLLSVFPQLRDIALEKMLARLGVLLALSIGLAYVVVNFLPFDSYSIAWDRRQIFFFVLYYLMLTIPFTISGLGIGSALAKGAGRSHLFYAANLVGSGVGALLAPLALWLGGVPGAVLLSAILGLGVTLIAPRQGATFTLKQRWPRGLVTSFTLVGLIIFIVLATLNSQSHSPLGMTISPYKGLAQARRFPNSEIIFSRWNAISRLDIVKEAGTHQLPGLSYLYPGVPPQQLGLSLDADSLQAVTLIAPQDFAAADYLPESIAFKLVPQADVLVLGPGGGLGILQALAGEPAQITAVVDNPLIPQAIASAAADYWDIYAQPKVRTVTESERVFLQHGDELYDIIFLPLTDAYRPVSSGAYSLAEDYLLTVESFSAMLSRLHPDGVLVFTRWMQMPPSESLRAIATLVEGLEQKQGVAAADKLVVYRGIQTVTILLRPAGWPQEMLAAIRAFTQDRKFDLVWMPNIQEEEVNRFNRLPEPSFYFAFRELLTTPDRVNFYENYTYDISPPIDDRPFFYHFFTWEQTPEVLATLGHTWQPFGGSGYFLLLVLLTLTVILSLGLILLPLWLQPGGGGRTQAGRWRALLYFALLGIAFLFVEIPLIQRWILFLGHPTYAFATVVVTLLLFSGVGSALARATWLPRRTVFVFLVVFALSTPLAIAQFSDYLLGLPAWGRLILGVLMLVPLGVLMGLPFPLGVAWLESHRQNWIPWAWAVNGCTSVIASILAAILSLSYGFSLVLFLGAGAYAGAAALYASTMKD